MYKETEGYRSRVADSNKIEDNKFIVVLRTERSLQKIHRAVQRSKAAE